MRFTIHTPSGETYTTPDNTHPHIEEGTGALHIIQDEGEWHTIAVFPAGQWASYTADLPHQQDATDPHTDLFHAVRAYLKPRVDGRKTVDADLLPLYLAYCRACPLKWIG